MGGPSSHAKRAASNGVFIKVTQLGVTFFQVQQMAAHAQYCSPGDHTVEGTVMGIQDVKSKAADEYFVFVLSDADLERCWLCSSLLFGERVCLQVWN